MLILLPPSETKASGGDGGPLDFAGLSWPSLNPVREAIAADLVALSSDREAAMAALKLGPKLAAEVDANAELLSSPTMPALDRYTGVLYDALDAPSLPASARGRLAVGSALFGVVGGLDMIPRYRLSGGSKLPRRDASGSGAGAEGSKLTEPAPTMRARWGAAITDALADEPFVVDLRSGAYLNLGKVPGAVTATVVTTEGKVVSHFNKHHKGLLARALATEPVDSLDAAVGVARAAGHDAVARDGDIVITVPA